MSLSSTINKQKKEKNYYWNFKGKDNHLSFALSCDIVLYIQEENSNSAFLDDMFVISFIIKILTNIMDKQKISCNYVIKNIYSYFASLIILQIS